MPFTPPPYPEKLKRKTWDANKGLLAKAKGFTGMGDAMADLESKYNAIKWLDIFDLRKKWGGLNERGTNGFTIAKLDKDVADARSNTQSGEVSKLSKQALALSKLAQETAKGYGANPLYKKAAQLAAEIGREADRFGVATNANSLSNQIKASYDEVMLPLKGTKDLLQKNLRGAYDRMKKACDEYDKKHGHSEWSSLKIMDRCRDFNQYIGNSGKMVAWGVDIPGSASDYKKYFDDMNLYARVDCPFKETASSSEIKKHSDELHNLVTRGKALCW